MVGPAGLSDGAVLRLLALLVAALGGVTGCAVASTPPVEAARAPARSGATLRVDEPEGALIYVDDQAMGVVPSVLTLEPGAREVAVYAAGHRIHRQRVELPAGQARRIAVDLEATPQRVASFVLLGAGAAAMTAGIVLGAMAQAERGGVGMWQRDGAEMLSLGAGLSGGLGATLIVTGGTLFVLDVPELPDAPGVMIGPSGVTGRF